MKILYKNLKKELNEYFNKLKYKFIITKNISLYFKYIKIYKLVKSLDIKTLRYSYNLYNSNNNIFGIYKFDDNKIYFIINEKYFLYRKSYSGDIYLEKFDCNLYEALNWLDENELYITFTKTIDNIKFKTISYSETDKIPDRIKIKRIEKINKVLKND